MSNIAKIKKFSIENGKGIRTSIFFSGCEHHCKNCFNSELWDFNVGKPFTRNVYENEIKSTINEHISGISILGGEPMHPNNINNTYRLVRWFKDDFPDKNIWLWTGYTLDELFDNCDSDIIYFLRTFILKNIDVLVDGRFIEEQKDLTLKWRGSKNQMVIDMKESLKQGKTILLED